MEEVNEVTTEQQVEEVKNPEAVLAELRRAQDDLKTLRAEKKELEKSLETFQNTPDADEWKSRALKAETKLALNAQGIKDVERLMPYIGTDGLDFDDEGNVSGLNERLETLKKDLPEVFDPKVRAGGKGDIFAGDTPIAPKTGTEAQVARIFGRV